MGFADLRAQCEPFLVWARQYPHMYECIGRVFTRIQLLIGVSGLDACTELRDCFHALFVYTDEGGFDSLASLFCGAYEQYSLLRLNYFVG